SPGRHLLVLGAGQVAQLLAADREEWAEDDDLLVLAALHDGLEARTHRQRALAGAGTPAQRDDADVGVEQHLEGDALLGGTTVESERLPVAAHEVDLLVGSDPAQ